MICCGPEVPLMEFNPLNVVASATSTQTVEAPNSCGGGTQNVTGDFPTWWTDNTAIATASRNQIHGVAVGTTKHHAQSIPMYWGFKTYDTSCPTPQPIASAGTNVATVSCSPSSVSRGGTTTCTAKGPSGSTFSNWKFSDGTNAPVTSSSTSSQWSGVMVTSGTISVTVTSGGGSATPTAQITVNARNWHTNPASAASVPNGTFYELPVPPQPTGVDSGLGKFNESTSNSASPNSTIIGGDGPNTGYAYFATQLSISTLFQYEINPDLQSSTSQFSVHQWGACGYISWSNLLAQTNRHEYNSSTQSHYAFYTTSISSSTSNPGDFFEQQVAPPGADLVQFANSTATGLKSRYDQIIAATSVEPFAVNYSETGTFLGNINYAPYASCP